MEHGSGFGHTGIYIHITHYYFATWFLIADNALSMNIERGR